MAVRRGTRFASWQSGLLRSILLVLTVLCSRPVKGVSEDVQRTLALVKPDAVRAGNASKIKGDIIAAGFAIVAERELLLSPGLAEQFYAEHAGREFYADLVEFMSSGHVLAMVLERQDAVAAWRRLIGPTNSALARSEFRDSIRAKYGTDKTQNAVHGSDSVERAQEEIRLVFGKFSEESLSGQFTNVLVGTSALAAAIYGVTLVTLGWPLWVKERERDQT